MGKGINETKRGKTNDFLLVISGTKSVPGTEVPIKVPSKKYNSKALSRQVVLLGVSRKKKLRHSAVRMRPYTKILINWEIKVKAP
jgi:hypothetical protein